MCVNIADSSKTITICSKHQDCNDSLQCLMGLCIDPCQTGCGESALCTVKEHRIKCDCPPNQTGNPNLKCIPISTILNSTEFPSTTLSPYPLTQTETISTKVMTFEEITPITKSTTDVDVLTDKPIQYEMTTTSSEQLTSTVQTITEASIGIKEETQYPDIEPRTITTDITAPPDTFIENISTDTPGKTTEPFLFNRDKGISTTSYYATQKYGSTYFTENTLKDGLQTTEFRTSPITEEIFTSTSSTTGRIELITRKSKITTTAKNLVPALRSETDPDEFITTTASTRNITSFSTTEPIFTIQTAATHSMTETTVEDITHTPSTLSKIDNFTKGISATTEDQMAFTNETTTPYFSQPLPTVEVTTVETLTPINTEKSSERTIAETSNESSFFSTTEESRSFEPITQTMSTNSQNTSTTEDNKEVPTDNGMVSTMKGPIETTLNILNSTLLKISITSETPRIEVTIKELSTETSTLKNQDTTTNLIPDITSEVTKSSSQAIGTSTLEQDYVKTLKPLTTESMSLATTTKYAIESTILPHILTTETKTETNYFENKNTDFTTSTFSEIVGSTNVYSQETLVTNQPVTKTESTKATESATTQTYTEVYTESQPTVFPITQSTVNRKNESNTQGFETAPITTDDVSPVEMTTKITKLPETTETVSESTTFFESSESITKGLAKTTVTDIESISTLKYEYEDRYNISTVTPQFNRTPKTTMTTEQAKFETLPITTEAVQKDYTTSKTITEMTVVSDTTMTSTIEETTETTGDEFDNTTGDYSSTLNAYEKTTSLNYISTTEREKEIQRESSSKALPVESTTTSTSEKSVSSFPVDNISTKKYKTIEELTTTEDIKRKPFVFTTPATTIDASGREKQLETTTQYSTTLRSSTNNISPNYKFLTEDDDLYKIIIAATTSLSDVYTTEILSTEKMTPTVKGFTSESSTGGGLPTSTIESVTIRSNEIEERTILNIITEVLPVSTTQSNKISTTDANLKSTATTTVLNKMTSTTTESSSPQSTPGNDDTLIFTENPNISETTTFVSEEITPITRPFFKYDKTTNDISEETTTFNPAEITVSKTTETTTSTERPKYKETTISEEFHTVRTSTDIPSSTSIIQIPSYRFNDASTLTEQNTDNISFDSTTVSAETTTVSFDNMLTTTTIYEPIQQVFNESTTSASPNEEQATKPTGTDGLTTTEKVNYDKIHELIKNATKGPPLSNTDFFVDNLKTSTVSILTKTFDKPSSNEPCTHEMNCTTSETCIKNICVNPCSVYRPCPSPTICVTINHQISCNCQLLLSSPIPTSNIICNVNPGNPFT